jgi:hypothetical protein
LYDWINEEKDPFLVSNPYSDPRFYVGSYHEENNFFIDFRTLFNAIHKINFTFYLSPKTDIHKKRNSLKFSRIGFEDDKKITCLNVFFKFKEYEFEYEKFNIKYFDKFDSNLTLEFKNGRLVLNETPKNVEIDDNINDDDLQSFFIDEFGNFDESLFN